MSSYNIITYGCQMNEHDSENIAGMLEALGYIHEEDPWSADLVVMNTCSVREKEPEYEKIMRGKPTGHYNF